MKALRLRLAAGPALATLALAAGAAERPAPSPPPAAGVEAPRPALRFDEVGARAGARFVHATRRFDGRSQADVLEMFTDGGAAVAVGDFDGDGWEDLFLTDSDTGRPNHLLHNLTGERGELAFRDVAAAAGVAGGNEPDAIVADALWLDYDDDGRQDLLVARFGTPLLYRNLGPGPDGGVRFAEVAARSGLTRFANTLSVVAVDVDRDGWLDLVFGNYFPPRNLLRLDDPHVLPDDLDSATNGGGVTLWRNVALPDGSRGFTDATAAAGLADYSGWTLDVGHGDLDDDGWEDLYVAADYGSDHLFHNRGDGTFADVTERAIGFDTRKGMNVDVADYDGDGRLDVFVTNITDDYMRECNMLWHNGGDGTFVDVSRETGTCDSDWGWGGKFADLDNDGWLDLYTVNGLRSAGPQDYIPLLLERTILVPGVDFTDLRSYPAIGDRSWSGYQRQRLFHNLGDGTFREAAAEAGLDNDLDGRGVAIADLDRDGRLDIVQTNARQPSLLFHNVGGAARHWVELELVGGPSNRDAVGARVTLTAGGRRRVREVDGGNGYAAQSSRRLHFGLGAVDRVDAVEVRWPDGRVERRAGGPAGPALSVDRVTRLVEGALEPSP